MFNPLFKILVAEDDEWYSKLLVHTISLNPDFEVIVFSNGEDLLKALDESVDVVTVDYRLPDMNGQQLLLKVKEKSPATEVVMISEQGEIDVAVEALKNGAYDYIVKSNDIRDRLLNTLNNIRKAAGMKKEITSLREEVQTKYSFDRSIIGSSDALRKVFSLISKAVTSNITVMITGETGTGKEVVAKAIHYNSNRKQRPFVAINMAAIPADLLESELFGHEKGAFTGALNRRKGKFEEANGGTIFLDEIGEMDINFQAKLLRVLQEKEVTRIGSNEPVKLDCRVIVATNRNLQDDVKHGAFREDLYYRLLGLPVHLPPLRERDTDVLILARHFIQAFCRENEMPEKHLSEDARQKLMSYSWPGNIRELKAVIELAVVMADGVRIESSDISLAGSDVLPDVLTTEMSMREYNHRIVEIYMKKYDNNTKMVADKLDIGQTTVYRLLKESRSPQEDPTVQKKSEL